MLELRPLQLPSRLPSIGNLTTARMCLAIVAPSYAAFSGAMAGEGSGEFGEGLGNSTAVDVDGDVTSDESESEMLENAMIARHERGAVNDGNYDSEDLVSEDDVDEDEEDGDGAMDLDEDGNRYDDPGAVEDGDAAVPSAATPVAAEAAATAKPATAKPATAKPATATAKPVVAAAATSKVAGKPKAVGKGKAAARPRPTDDAAAEAPPAAKKQRVAKPPAAGSSGGNPPAKGLSPPTKKAVKADAVKYLERARSKGLTAVELIKSIKKQSYFKPQKQLVINFLIDLLPRISVQRKIEGEERYIIERFFVKKNKF